MTYEVYTIVNEEGVVLYAGRVDHSSSKAVATHIRKINSFTAEHGQVYKRSHGMYEAGSSANMASRKIQAMVGLLESDGIPSSTITNTPTSKGVRVRQAMFGDGYPTNAFVEYVPDDDILGFKVVRLRSVVV